jgi:hypothetical protein
VAVGTDGVSSCGGAAAGASSGDGIGSDGVAVGGASAFGIAGDAADGKDGTASGVSAYTIVHGKTSSIAAASATQIREPVFLMGP